MFLTSLDFKTLPRTNFYALYCGCVERIIAHQCARFKGKYTLQPPGTDWRSRWEQLAQCQRMERNITDLRRELKGETQLNRQVELNMRIKMTDKELALAVVSL